MIDLIEKNALIQFMLLGVIILTQFVTIFVLWRRSARIDLTDSDKKVIASFLVTEKNVDKSMRQDVKLCPEFEAPCLGKKCLAYFVDSKEKPQCIKGYLLS